MLDIPRLENLIHSYVDTPDVLGLALAVVDCDEVVNARGFGLASAEDGRQVTSDTLFDVGSIAKTVLATLVMRLVDAGTLDLDRPVAEYLPGFAFSDPDLGRKVTLCHLLSHTSGLPSAGKDWGSPDADALARFAREQIASYGFVAEPGQVHLYSNTAIALAGYVVEVVTGRSYRELAQDLVFAPLEMSRTTFDHSVAMTYPLALPHREESDGLLEVVHRWTDNRAGEPSGFLCSTALDLAHLAILHLNGGSFRGEQVLSPESAAEMQASVVTIPKLGARHPFAHLTSGYALGLQTGTYRGERVRRHGGISQSFDCFFELMPARRRGFVALTNWSREGSRLVDLILRLYDHLLFDLPIDGDRHSIPVPEPPADAAHRRHWPAHVGTYLSVGLGKLISVRIWGDDLVVEEEGCVHPLIAVSEQDYYYDDEGQVLLSFLPAEPAPSGPTEYLYLGGAAFRRFQPDPDFVPNPATWHRYVGRYRDASNLDPDSTLEVHLVGDELWLAGEGEDEACRHLADGAFLSCWGLLEFADGAGATPCRLAVGKATRYERVDGRTGQP